jgi:ABC-type cobalt transport system substrate-binding protein
MDGIEGQIYKKYFIGKTKPGEWSSVYTYKPHNPAIKNLRGEIFACVSIKGPKDFSVSTAGNLLLDKLHESYFENHTDKTLTALEKAVLETAKYLQKLLENDSAADTGIELDLLTVVLIDDLIFVVSFGNCSLHVFREGNISEIASMLKDPTGEGMVRIGSLIAKKGDVFVLGTPEVSEELTTDEMLDMVVEFSEMPLKNRLFANEAAIAAMMIGYQLERATHAQVASKKLQEARRQFVKEPEPDTATDEETGGTEKSDSLEEDLPENNGQPDSETKGDGELLQKTETVAKRSALAGLSTLGVNMKGFIGKAGTSVKSGLKKTSQQISHHAKRLADLNYLKNFRSGAKNKLPVADIAQEEMVHEETTAELQSELEAAGIKQDQKRTRNVDTNQKTYKVILDKIWFTLTRLARDTKGLVWDNWFGMGHDSIYLRGAARKRRWGFLIILILVVVAILYFSIQSISEGQKLKAAEDQAATHLSAAIQIISDVNANIATLAKAPSGDAGVAAALTKLTSAESELVLVKPVAKFNSDVQIQEDKITSIKDLLNKTIVVANPTIVTDAAGVFPGAAISDFTAKDGVIYMTDSKNGKVYKVAYTGGTLQELANGFTGPTSISADDKGNLIVLDANTDAKLSTVSIGDGSQKRITGSSESRLPSPGQIDFAAIGSGRIYSYDTSKTNVLYMEKSGSNYGLPQARFNLNEIATATDISVMDLKIYLLLPFNQGIYRAFNNQNDTPTLTGLEAGEDLKSATALFVDDENVYIADPGKQRIIVFVKGVTSMPLKAQYVYRGSDANAFKNIKEVFADKKNNRILVLDDSKIYSLTFNQLANF